MGQIALWLIVILVWSALFTCYRRVALVHLAGAGLFAYSIPALIGITTTATTPQVQGYLYPTSLEATLAMVLVWMGFGLALVIGLGFNSQRIERLQANYDLRSECFLWTCFVGVWAFYLYISWHSHLAFFLEDRDEFYANFGLDLIIWRWVVAAGLVGSVLWKRPILFSIFAVHMLLVALTGDRTVPLIATAASLLVFFWNRSVRRTILSPWAWLAISGVGAGIFLMKPVYFALKQGLPVVDTLMATSTRSFLMQWEAFIIHEILEKVIESDFQYSFLDMVRGSLAQMLVIPSAFGFRSSEFNAQMQSALFPDVEFGLAHNLWAQWYAVAGWPGLIVGGFAFGLIILAMQRFVQQWGGFWRLLPLLLGAIVAAYCYRNSVENTLAFWRQALISLFLLASSSWGMYVVLKALRGSFKTPSVGASART